MTKIFVLVFVFAFVGCSESRRPSQYTPNTFRATNNPEDGELCRESSACKKWCQTYHNCANACALNPKGECYIVKAQCENQLAGCYNRLASDVMVQMEKEKVHDRLPASPEAPKK